MDNKFSDQNIKEYFNSRKIEPSGQSWDRLDAMLSYGDKPVKKVKFNYWYYAASIAAILMISLIFNTKKDQAGKNNAMVINPTNHNKEILSEPELDVNPKITKQDALFVTQSDNENIQPTAKKAVEKQAKKEILPQHHLIEKESISEIAVLNKIEENNSINLHMKTEVLDIIKTDSDVFVQKSLRVDPLALLASLENNEKSNHEIQTKKKVSGKTKVNPSTLLKDAEEAAALGFMSKVFKTIQETSGTVITSVNNRNIVK